MDRFGLDVDHMRAITHSTQGRFAKLASGEAKPNDVELRHISEVFNIKPKQMLNSYELPILTMRVTIEIDKYKDILDAYFEILKEYYPDPWVVYALARIPYRNTFDKFLDALFPKPPKKTDSLFEAFTPNYLAINGDRMLIVNIEDSILEIKEVTEEAKEKRFIYGKYIYVRTGIIQLKKYEPTVQRYF